MSSPSHHVSRLAALTRALALGLPVALTLAPGTTALPTAHASQHTPARAADPTTATASGVYLVTLDRQPTALHPATRPAPGGRFDRTRPEVVARAARLRAEQDRVLASVGNPEVLYRYTTAVNGFAAELVEAQVKRLRSTPGVALVERSTTRPTAGTGPVLGLRAAESPLAGRATLGPAGAGRGVVVGVVDTGIWPENPSFAGLPQQTPGTSSALPGFHGACASAEEWTERDCNDKVVSARYFVRGFGAGDLASTEILSPRDATGHGSHAAATAAGEPMVAVEIDDQGFGRDSGMAPAARLAVYKACWTAPDPADDGCTTADAVAAIDRAVGDGVDVLSYSVTGSDNPADTVSRAFLAATGAGVFVATAAGNAGPRPGTVGNAAPWVATVGASTHRVYQGGVRLGDGRTLVGAMTSDSSVPSRPVVLAEDAPAATATTAAAARCETGALDAALVEDKVVVCDRGVIPRVDKSAAVAAAGGVGMVLVNTTADTRADTTADTVQADVHAVPTVHLDVSDATALKSYVRDNGDQARAALVADASEPVDVPVIAPFSGRGPVPGGDLLKPDLTAPGVGVVGAVAPPANSGRLWDLYSGTSVSAPHVAGLAAYLRGLHPDWSPARVKSAMMTTARPLEGASGPFAEGAGRVSSTALLDPGLVLDSRPSAWRHFLDGSVRTRDLNLPSVAVGRLLGRATVVRRFTSVARTTETYTVSVTGLRGIDAVVRPSVVTLRPGQTRRVLVRLVATPMAPLDTYARGALTVTGPSHSARLPMVVRAARVAAPHEVGADVDSGSLVVTGRTGDGAPVRLKSSGLVPAQPVGLTLQPGPIDVAEPQVDGDTYASEISVPAGTEAARFELTSHNTRDDVDLYVYRDGVLVDAATGPSADATVTLVRPAPGDYEVYVHAVAAGNGAASTSQLSTWVVGGTGGDELSLEAEQPDGTPGDEFRYTASWRDLDPTRRWLGVVRYVGSDKVTLVRVD